MKSSLLFATLFQAAQYALAAPVASSDDALPSLRLCSNAGLQWAYYTDEYKTDSLINDEEYDPAVIKSTKPVERGTTTYLNYFVQAETIGPDEPVYKDPKPRPSSYFILNHRGYIYARRTGSYVFQVTGADDISYLWVSSKAYRGWNATNSDQTVFYDYNTFEPGTGSSSAFLTAGKFYPLRFVYKQGAGNAVFAYKVTDPKGNVLISSDPLAKISPDIIQYSCDGLLAPKYPAFGQEQ